jgi:hypothetical protein
MNDKNMQSRSAELRHQIKLVRFNCLMIIVMALVLSITLWDGAQ